MTFRPRYVMNDDGTLREAGLEEWAKAYDNRWNKKTAVGEREVSTVFLSSDHNFTMKGPPVMFETMVFGGGPPWFEYQERYTTKVLAERGHAVIVAAIQQGLTPGDMGPRTFVDSDAVTA